MQRSALAFAALAIACAPALADVSSHEVEDAVAGFKKSYASHEEADRLAAVSALAETHDRRVVPVLAAALEKDSSPAVRAAAAAALGEQWSASAVHALLHALAPSRAPREVTTAVIAALGRTESEEAVPALLALLKVRNKFYDGNEEQCVFTGPALDALGAIGSALATHDLLEYLNRQANIAHQEANVRLGGEPLVTTAMNALAAITGQKLRTEVEWRRWWFANRSKIRTIPVYRCTQCGRTFDRPDAKTKCPEDGDAHPDAARFLKTRYEGGGLGAPDPAPAKGKKAGK